MRRSSTRPLRAPLRCEGTAKAAPPLPIPASYQPSCFSFRLSVDQLVALDPLLGVEVDDGSHQHALLVRAARVDGKRLAQGHRALALVNVPVEGKERLVAVDGVADRLGS